MPDAGGDDSGYIRSELLGRGGSASVFLALRADGQATGREATVTSKVASKVALKVLRADRRDNRHLARLQREFDFARQVRHPHIVTMYAHGNDWLTMQYVDGGNATSLGGLSDRLLTLTQIADALDFVHRVGIVHCDVKPANILVFRNFSAGGAVLIDFGVAHSLAEDVAVRLSRTALQRFSLDPARRITHHAMDDQDPMHASLPYASPEILMNQIPSAASDQYSLACTAVELLIGEPPFTADEPGALIDAHLEKPVPRLTTQAAWLPHAFDGIVVRAMAKDPDRRYDSCAEFIDELTHALVGGRVI